MQIGYKVIKVIDNQFRSKWNQSFLYNPEQNEILNTKPLVHMTDSGFHFYTDLQSAVGNYDKNDKREKLFKIEYCGEAVIKGNIGVTKAFRFVEEVSEKEIIYYKRRSRYVEALNVLTGLINANPYTIISGSVGLFIRGLCLDRSEDADLDIIVPFYFDYSTDKSVQFLKPSGNDFDYCVQINGVQVDIKIDPFARYEAVKFEGREIKCAPLASIIEAKCKYALKQSGGKHQEDLKELLGIGRAEWVGVGDSLGSVSTNLAF